MFTQELINKVKAFKKEKYATASAASSRGADIATINYIRSIGDKAANLLDAYSCLNANAVCKSYSKDVRGQFEEMANERYEELMDLIEGF